MEVEDLLNNFRAEEWQISFQFTVEGLLLLSQNSISTLFLSCQNHIRFASCIGNLDEYNEIIRKCFEMFYSFFFCIIHGKC